jgi:hypothetical protein
MKFVHPEILWALSALSVPIIVHLFNFRKFKKMMFPNVAFLKEIKQETQSKSKLKHLLILLTRLMAMACIIFAFAQPYVPLSGTTARPGDRAVSLYLDNSFSMDARGESGPLLDLARNKSLEIVNGFGPADKFQLITNDFYGAQQRLVSKEEMLDLIQDVQPSASGRRMSEVLARQREVLNRSGLDNKSAFYISDFQRSSIDLESISNDTTISQRLVPTQAEERSNVYIDSVWFSTPLRQLNQPEQLYIRVKNDSESDKENIPVILFVNGEQKSMASVSIAADAAAEAVITFTNTTPGNKQCSVKVDDYPISFDDVYYFSFKVSAQIAVMEIRGSATPESNAIPAVFSDDPYFLFTSIGENVIDYSRLVTQQLVVLNEPEQISTGLAAELTKFITNGGSVVLFPSYTGNIDSYNAWLSPLISGKFGPVMNSPMKADRVNWEHYIYKTAFEKPDGNVEMPMVQRFYLIETTGSTALVPMLTLQDGHDLLSGAGIGQGKVYVCAVPLEAENSNFVRHALFPATLLRMAEFSQPSLPLSYTIGQNEAIVLRNLQMPGESTFRMESVDGGGFIPEHRNAGGNVELFVREGLEKAGNNLLLSGDSTVAVLSFNYRRLESATAVADIGEIMEFALGNGWSNWSVLDGTLDSIGKSAVEVESGKKYWYSMIVWALILLAIEILLIKFWRR